MAESSATPGAAPTAQGFQEPDPLPLRFALHFLHIARDQLQVATGDKGGHRLRAWLLLDQCAAEVRACIAHDHRNGVEDEFRRRGHAAQEQLASPAPSGGDAGGIT